MIYLTRKAKILQIIYLKKLILLRSQDRKKETPQIKELADINFL